MVFIASDCMKLCIYIDNLAHYFMAEKLMNIGNESFEFDLYVSPFFLGKDSEYLQCNKVKYKKFKLVDILFLNTDYFIVFNDWNTYNKLIILLLKCSKIRSICIQESVIDFSKNNKMQFSDYAFLQGKDSIRYIKNQLRAYITGNLRYEYLSEGIEKKNLNKPVLINFNLFFKELSGREFEWLDSVISVCDSLGVDYMISKHPTIPIANMKGYQNVIPSGADNVSKQIDNSSLVITRFSSFIHETILRNKKVVYFDPFDEESLIGYDFNLKANFTFVTRCKTMHALERTLSKKNEAIECSSLVEYLIGQIGTLHSSSSTEITCSILNKLKGSSVPRMPLRLKVDLIVNLLAYPLRSFVGRYVKIK